VRTFLKIAFICHSLAVLLLGTFGWVYLFRSEFMPYHAVAIAQEWSDVDREFQIIILALMRSAGGAWLATALAIAMLLWGPFRQGQRWTYWAIPAIGLMVSVPALYATLYVRHHTAANPPWGAAVAGILLLGIGLVTSLQTSRPG
jgi:hypothetical protein